ncbi:MAG TPA: hypothetical protein PLD20_07545 [Blastocatellia bacterium]|nr:hypothetical protein [Blastocatellia bacterium]HMX27990.1 hypothetical protein [Blastocatellia bacterium]HMY71775.1 hypothetical protein [Blastocatellia bacterium]HMZ17766.1 hypothetical protein [Blastocatellia bacterium]HNG32583.1 hypothetical protein [Blastocatellia bacterium]
MQKLLEEHLTKEPVFQAGDWEFSLNHRLGLVMEADRRMMANLLGIGDEKIPGKLQELGFMHQTLPLLHIVPMIQVAWADGCVTARESSLILEAARRHGIHSDHAAYPWLLGLFHEPASPEFFEECLHAIGAMLAAMPTEQRETHLRELLASCRRVAEASGGLGFIDFGNKVSREERSLLEHLCLELHVRPQARQWNSAATGLKYASISDRSESWL